MLVGLYVRDVVLIDQIDLDFAGGLTVLTGETGAGKSILLDALGLALGARAESGLVRPGAERATVSATFAVAANHPARRLLAEHGLADDEALVLRRAVPREGASRAFVNDAPVSASLLKELGAALVEMQGQHDQQQLLAGAGHRRLLDGFAGLETDVAMVGRAFAELDRARRTLAALADEIARATAEQDLIRHYVAELDALDPKADEEAGLAAMRALLMAAEKSGEVLREATERLAAVGPGLAAVRQALGRLPDAARPRFAAAAEA
ncbi:MAG: DNA repair protein RecN, partial [Alphaproteobacteria bacterium]|nr:DNA repair protein RecN [Alphaproteobacteria bacterium]